MSDSSATQWKDSSTFGKTDHGNLPPELNNLLPVLISVSGDMKDFILVTSKQTQIKVGGDMVDCSFSGENLHPNDITSIDVTGQIFNRSPYSFVTLFQGIPNLPASELPLNGASSWNSIFSAALDPNLLATLQAPANLAQSQLAAYASQNAAVFPAGNPGFVYNPATMRLGFSGQMPQSVRAALAQPLTLLRFGPDGFPVLDPTGHFLTDQFTFAASTVIEGLYQASLAAPAASDPAALGYRIGGPGQFNVRAGSISLGNSYGILSCGVADPTGNRYANLAPFTKAGADVNVTIDGDLSLLTSTIASLGGGDVNVTSTGGSMDLGSQELFNVRRGVALGVYTSGRGNVSVTSLGDININGSRVAAYNGGDITIKSLEGNVNAGSGGTTFVSVPVSYVNPATGQAGLFEEEVFGSGIVANTLVKPGQVPGSASTPGNITVETPRGSIFASQGGIVQEALNGNVSAGPTVTLIAGTRPTATSPGYKGNIDLGDPGVIGGTVSADANGNITGLVISRQNSTINAAQSFSGTVLSGGTANLSARGSISGTVVGIGGINASGGQGVSAALLSQNVSVGGAQSQSTLGDSRYRYQRQSSGGSAIQQRKQRKNRACRYNQRRRNEEKGRAPRAHATSRPRHRHASSKFLTSETRAITGFSDGHVARSSPWNSDR